MPVSSQKLRNQGCVVSFEILHRPLYSSKHARTILMRLISRVSQEWLKWVTGESTRQKRVWDESMGQRPMSLREVREWSGAFRVAFAIPSHEIPLLTAIVVSDNILKCPRDANTNCGQLGTVLLSRFAQNPLPPT